MAGNGPDSDEDLVDDFGGLDIGDEFQENRKKFQAKTSQRFNVRVRENTPYQTRSLNTLNTDIKGVRNSKKPEGIVINLYKNLKDSTRSNKELFQALMQHRRHSDWKDKELAVKQNIGGRAEVYILTPSKGGQIFLKHVTDHNLWSAPKYPDTVQCLDTFAESNERRKDMASMMLEAIRNPQNGQPDFGEIFTDEDARKAAVQFILMTQIAEAVPPLGNQGTSGRTPGMDAYFRSALKQIVKSNGAITFQDIYDHGIVTGLGGTQAGRDMADPTIHHDDRETLPAETLRDENKEPGDITIGLFKKIVDGMSDVEEDGDEDEEENEEEDEQQDDDDDQDDE